uniref:Uncharacterized protein n=1 Tax=Arundo donax TaxID=35708 RepID=A0A0A9EEI7_ARUDO
MPMTTMITGFFLKLVRPGPMERHPMESASSSPFPLPSSSAFPFPFESVWSSRSMWVGLLAAAGSESTSIGGVGGRGEAAGGGA